MAVAEDAWKWAESISRIVMTKDAKENISRPEHELSMNYICERSYKGSEQIKIKDNNHAASIKEVKKWSEELVGAIATAKIYIYMESKAWQ